MKQLAQANWPQLTNICLGNKLSKQMEIKLMIMELNIWGKRIGENYIPYP
jgi:hypothetical protein